MPTVVYGSTPDALRAWRRVSSRGDVEALVFGVDDTPKTIAGAIERAYQGSIAAVLPNNLAGRLRALPPVVDAAISTLLEEGVSLRSVSELARYCGCSRRALYRACALGGLGTPYELLRLGWTVRAYRLCALQGGTIKVAAFQTGDASGRRLREAVCRIVRCLPSQMRDLGVTEFTERLLGWVRRQSA
jgi:hypothetical protein